jgi:type IV pilus assembly protein PilO
MKKRWDSYVIMSIAVGVTAAFCFLFFWPQQRELTRLRASVRAKEEQQVRWTSEIAKLSQVEADLKRANELLADYRTRVPDTAEVGDFMEEVSAIAERLGLRDQNIVPLTPETRGPVTALPIRISFEASFAAIFSFLREVEELPRVARVTELVVGYPDEDEDAGNRDGRYLKTELTMQIYYETTRAGSRV